MKKGKALVRKLALSSWQRVGLPECLFADGTCRPGTWSETPAWFRTKLSVASDASIALSFSDVSDAHQFFTSPLRSSNNLVLQPGFTGLSTPFPVAAPCPLLVSPSPARPSDNGAGIDGFLDSEVVQQVADLRHGQGQQIGGQIGQVLSPRWPPFARRSGRPGRASPR